jgi:hypothetical protein
MDLRFWKEKTYFWNTFWSAGSILEIPRVSLAKVSAEPVSLVLGRWIRFERIRSNQERKRKTPAGYSGPTAAPWPESARARRSSTKRLHRPPNDKRGVPGERAGHGELTYGQI